MEERTIKAIPPMPFAVMMGAIEAVLGLIAGILIAIFYGAFLAMLGSAVDVGALGWLGVIFGVGAIIILPIMMFIGGLIQGLIIAVIYNFLAPKIGGIKLQFEEGSRTPPPP